VGRVDVRNDGTVYEPGHLRRAANAHTLGRMWGHGVDHRLWAVELELPGDTSFVEAGNVSGSRLGPLSRAQRLVKRWVSRFGPRR
jgi:hypothetical protein